MSVTVHVKQFTFTMKINYTNIAQYMYYMFATIICWNLVVFYWLLFAINLIWFAYTIWSSVLQVQYVQYIANLANIKWSK